MNNFKNYDDYTHFYSYHVYLISCLFEALDCFRKYINDIENQLDRSIKVFKLTKKVISIWEIQGIIYRNKKDNYHIVILRNLQQNDVVKTKSSLARYC
jgi:hypothetical protein